MTKWIGLCIVFLNVAAMAQTLTSIYVQARVTNLITDIPTTSTTFFALMSRAVKGDQALRFRIYPQPTSGQITVSPPNSLDSINEYTRLSDQNLYDIPALKIRNINPVKTDTYYCKGLKLNYAGPLVSVTMIFSGAFNAPNVGTHIYCQCLGTVCTSSQTLPAVKV